MRPVAHHAGQALALLHSNKHIGLRIFWLGFIVPLGIKMSMYLAGYLFDFPVTISTFFGEGTVIYNVVDIQSLIGAALIFTMMFYYPLRMIINPRYAITFWRRSVKPIFSIRIHCLYLSGSCF